jgi:hypothetical protein
VTRALSDGEAPSKPEGGTRGAGRGRRASSMSGSWKPPRPGTRRNSSRSTQKDAQKELVGRVVPRSRPVQLAGCGWSRAHG